MVATIPVGTSPEGVAIDPATHTALVDNHKDSTVSVIDLKRHSVIWTIPVGQEPIDIAVDPALQLALVVNEKDYNTWQTTTIPIGKHPMDVAINQLDNRALVICDEDRSLLLIDLDTNTIVKNYDLNKLPRGVAVNNFTNIAGIVDDKGHSLMLIQLPNPVPALASLNPDTLLRGSANGKITISGSKFMAMAGTESLALTIHGAGFFDDTTFYVNGEPRSVKYDSYRKVTLDLTISDMEYGRYLDITAYNPLPGGGLSRQARFTVKNLVPVLSSISPASVEAGGGAYGGLCLAGGRVQAQKPLPWRLD